MSCGCTVIYRPWITRKDGTRDYASTHGFKAWRIPVPCEEHKVS